MTLEAQLVHIDGLPGPTFNHGGLSTGNLAAGQHAMNRSYPRKAALQSLYKMKHLTDMGMKQIVLPPQERPAIDLLRQIGFTGTEAQVLESAYRTAPNVVVACSAGGNWAANVATITPSIDTADGRLQLTPANLASQFHRSLEVSTNQMLFYALFPDPETIVQHDPLPSHPAFGDEGSANWLHFCRDYGEPGVYLMVYGKQAFEIEAQTTPKRFPARQTREASVAISRLHRIPPRRLLFTQQHPEVIDAGIFHNDLIALANQNCLIYHEQAWLNAEQVVDDLRQAVAAECRTELVTFKITAAELPIADLLASYLLNSQLITTGAGEMVLLAPVEARDNQRALEVTQRLIAADNPVTRVYYFDLSESMKNGGGPRCLALPVILTEPELQATMGDLVLTDVLYQSLVEWIHSHYREELLPGDVGDPELLYEVRRALDELTDLLDLGPLYPFQQE